MDAKFSAKFWDDPDLEEQPPEVKLTFAWAFTNGDRDLCGTFRFSARRFTFQTGLEASWLERTIKALPRSLVRDGEHVLCVKFIAHQFGRGPAMVANNIAKALAKPFALLTPQLQEAILTTYPELKPLLSPYEGVADNGKGFVAGETQAGSPSGSRAGQGHGKPQSRAEQSRAALGESEGDPSVEDVMRRGTMQGLSEKDCREFHAHYAGLGWTIRGSRMSQWWHWLPKWRTRGQEMVALKKAAAAAKGQPTPHSAELESIRAQLEWQSDPAKIGELKKRASELGA